MKNTIQIFAIFFSLITVFSCDSKRDLNGDLLFGLNPVEGDGDNNPTPAPDRLLKKMISHVYDEDMEEWEDQSIILNYEDKKLVSYEDEESGEKMDIEYNSSNKISKITTGAAMNSVFEYSGNNISKITTTYTGLSTAVTTYTYNGNKMVKSVTIMDISFPMPVKTYTEDTYEYQGNNVTKNTTKIGVYNPFTGNLEIDPGSLISLYEYDNKNSPYSLLPKEFTQFFSSISPQAGFYNSANNPVKSTMTDQEGNTTVHTINHTYDAENYTIKSTSGDEFYIYEYQ